VAGDTLVAFLEVEDEDGTSTITTLTGWTQIGSSVLSPVNGAYYSKYYVFWKTATGSEPGSYTWSAGTQGLNYVGIDGLISHFSGCNQANPINAFASVSGDTGLLVVPALGETFVSGEVYVGGYGDQTNVLPTVTSPTLTTATSNTGNWSAFFVGYYSPGSAAGAETYTTTSVYAVGVGFTLKPATAGDTPTHTLGRFTPTAYRRFPYNYEGSDLPQVKETQPHFLGHFTPTAYRRFPYNYEGSDLPQVVETQPHTLGRFTPSAFNLLPALRQNQDIVGAAAVVETQPHTLGRFTPSAFNLLPALRQNQDIVGAAAVVVPETNVHWLGKYTSTQYALLVNLRQNQDSVSPGSFVAETNVHTLGRFAPTQYAVFQNSGLWQNQDRVFPGSFVAETNPHWLGHFTPTLFPLVQTLGWRSNSDTFGPPGPTGPPPFYGHKFVGHDVGLLM